MDGLAVIQRASSEARRHRRGDVVWLGYALQRLHAERDFAPASVLVKFDMSVSTTPGRRH